MIIIPDRHLRLTTVHTALSHYELSHSWSRSPFPPRLMHPRGAHFPYEICIVPFGPFGQTRFITGTERQYNGREGRQCRVKGGRFITVPVHLSTGEQCNTQAHKILRPKHAFRRVSFHKELRESRNERPIRRAYLLLFQNTGKILTNKYPSIRTTIKSSVNKTAFLL